jgi:uncharacterized membrane protein
VIAHYYRGEMTRMGGWRSRIDLTTNWAITVVGAMLSVSLSAPTAHHGVVLLAMLLITLLLVIESRRYRFFDVYRARVRYLERRWFAEMFAPESGCTEDWLPDLGENLRRPTFLISLPQAFSRRLGRNYLWMYLILLLAWLFKTTTLSTPRAASARIVGSITGWLDNCALGPVPGVVVVTVVAGFYGWLFFMCLRHYEKRGELTYGEVHV